MIYLNNQTLETESLQSRDEVLAALKHRGERGAHKFSLIGRATHYAELYASHGCLIALHLAIVMPGAKPRAGDFRDESLVRNRKFEATLIYCADSGKDSIFDISDKELMFIPNIQMVQSPKGFTVPSFARLYDINYVPFDCGASILFESVLSGFTKNLQVIPHNETCVSIPGDGDNGVVKGGTKIVERIAEDGQHDVWQGLHVSYYKDIASRILLIVENHTVRVFFEKNLGFDIEIVDVMFGSTQF